MTQFAPSTVSHQPLFAHEPRTEQEVVCLFTAVLPYFRLSWLIERMQAAFPDCLVRDRDTTQTLRIEFELYSSHFIAHGHRADGCDAVVCWVDDHGCWPGDFQVFELCDIVERSCPWMIQHKDQRDPRAPWNQRTFIERAQRDGAEPIDLERIETVLAFARENHWGPQWLVNPSAVFAVGPGEQFFKIASTSRIGFPFCRVNCGDLFPELIQRLNATLRSPLFDLDDVESKSKDGRLSQLWPDNARFLESLDVWKWFAAHRDAARATV